jgi:hypothetical protein
MSDLTVVCPPADAVPGPSVGHEDPPNPDAPAGAGSSTSHSSSAGPTDHTELPAGAGAGAPTGPERTCDLVFYIGNHIGTIATYLVEKGVTLKEALPLECTSIQNPSYYWSKNATGLAHSDLDWCKYAPGFVKFAIYFWHLCLAGVPSVGKLYMSYYDPKSRTYRALDLGLYNVRWPGPASIIPDDELSRFLPVQSTFSKINIGAMLEKCASAEGRKTLLKSFDEVFFPKVQEILAKQEEINEIVKTPLPEDVENEKAYNAHYDRLSALTKPIEAEIRSVLMDQDFLHLLNEGLALFAILDLGNDW